MANRDLIVIGASAGGVEALRSVVSGLPTDLPATVLIVLHLPAEGRSALPAVLSRCGPLPVRHPVDGEALRPGLILVAPPDQHLTLEGSRVRLTHGPRENGHRPAIDPLFRSAARWHGPRVVGVILSGTLDDGAAGQLAVAAGGGVTVVQDPEDALYPGMPLSVLESLTPDHLTTAAGAGPLLARLAKEDIGEPPGRPLPAGVAAAAEPYLLAAADPAGYPGADPPSYPAGLGCPTCGGSLFAIDEGGLVRYRCQVGHAWSQESLLAEQAQALESALWMALRTLEDRAALCRRSATAAQRRGFDLTARRYRDLATDAESGARVIRSALGRTRRTLPPEP